MPDLHNFTGADYDGFLGFPVIESPAYDSLCLREARVE